MNILFLNSAKNWGGTEKWVHMAASVLSDENFVFLAYRSEEIGYKFDTKKYCLPFYSEIDLFTIYKLLQIIRSHNINLVIPTRRKDYVLAAIISQISGICSVLRLGIVRPLKNNFLNRLIYNYSNKGIIVNSKAIKKQLQSDLSIPSEKIRVIYNGVDTEHLKTLSFTESPEKNFPVQLIYIGELTERKNIGNIIIALSEVKKSTDNLGLVLIGKGNQENHLKSLSREYGVEANVTFLGFHSNPYPILAQSDIFIMPSKFEGISNALLEAMALGVPVISTDGGGGTTELIENGKNGFIIQYDNPIELADKIKQLIYDDGLKKKFALNGQKALSAKFSQKVMKKELTDYFINILQD